MMKKTKIVCTVSPSMDALGILPQMITVGMNVARFQYIKVKLMQNNSWCFDHNGQHENEKVFYTYEISVFRENIRS